jgi:RNA polymerase sigma-70 factor (ECF subfamily)
MPTADPDARLLARIARGDQDAFSTLYRRHLDTVLAYLRRRVDDPDLVLDLAAETFAAVVLGARRYRPGPEPAAAWLLGIARNKMLEALRRGRVESAARRRLGLDPLVVDDDDLRRVEERASDGAERLNDLLAELPEPTRRALVARVVDERAYSEIAAELACSEQVIRQRVHRGLSRLRQGLEEPT